MAGQAKPAAGGGEPRQQLFSSPFSPSTPFLKTVEVGVGSSGAALTHKLGGSEGRIGRVVGNKQGGDFFPLSWGCVNSQFLRPSVWMVAGGMERDLPPRVSGDGEDCGGWRNRISSFSILFFLLFTFSLFLLAGKKLSFLFQFPLHTRQSAGQWAAERKRRRGGGVSKWADRQRERRGS